MHCLKKLTMCSVRRAGNLDAAVNGDLGIVVLWKTCLWSPADDHMQQRVET